MPKPLFRPPMHLVKEWPEVFEDMYIYRRKTIRDSSRVQRRNKKDRF